MSNQDTAPPDNMPRLNAYRPVLRVLSGFGSLESIFEQVAKFALNRNLGSVTLVESVVVSLAHIRLPSEEQLLKRFKGDLGVALAEIKKNPGEHFPKATDSLGPVALTGAVTYPRKEEGGSLVLLTTANPDVIDEKNRVKDLFGIPYPGMLGTMAFCAVEQKLGKAGKSELMVQVQRLIPPAGIELELGPLELDEVSALPAD